MKQDYIRDYAIFEKIVAEGAGNEWNDANCVDTSATIASTARI